METPEEIVELEAMLSIASEQDGGHAIHALEFAWPKVQDYYATLAAQLRWRSAEDNPPKESGYYQTTWKFLDGSGPVLITYYDAKNNIWNLMHRVEIWLPLAIPPGNEKDESGI